MAGSDPEVVALTVPMVLSAVGLVISALVAVAVFFIKLAATTKDKLITIGIDMANQQAAMALKQNADTVASATVRFGELTEKIHELEIRDTQREGKQMRSDSEVHRLDCKDEEQGRAIQKLTSRLDLGARTASAMMPAQDDPDDLPPMRRRLPSVTGR
jgi:hypothetical protein